MSSEAEFEEIVDMHYPALYRFARSLTHEESDACDLTQETFYIWAAKSHQIRDKSKVKSWLFTTLHRQFLRKNRRALRFPVLEISEAEPVLPEVDAPSFLSLDASLILRRMERLDPGLKSAVSLFYLEDYTYAEIAEILNVPLGTVKSRISRGVAQLQRLMAEPRPVKSGESPESAARSSARRNP